jgi:integrase
MDIHKKHIRRFAKPSPKLHVAPLFRGLALGWRKNESGSTWTARLYKGGTDYEFHVIGQADDDLPADGVKVFSFQQASDRARDWAKHREAERNGQIHSGSFTVRDAVREYIAEQERVKRKSQHRVTAVANAFILPVLGDIELAKLTHTKLKRWRDDLAEQGPRVRAKKGKPAAHREVDMTDPEVMRSRQASVNRIWTILRAALNHAFTERKISSRSAWESIKPFRRVEASRPRYLSMDEAKALIPACEQDFQLLVRGALATGCRLGELTAMLVSAYEPEQGRCYIPTSKSGKPRHVDLTAESCAFFASITEGRSPSERMFLRNGVPWKQSEQARPMQDACEAAAITDCNFHALRHTWASHSVMNGMPLQVVSEQLGHADLRITVRFYAHLAPAYKREAVRSFAPNFL